MIATLPRTSPRAGRAAGGTGLIARGLELVRAWHKARRDRRELAGLSDLMLRDIGLSRADVDRELLQPFWRPVDYASLEQQRRRGWRRRAVPGLPR
jgi:uncharacterized protein YjiS (DUF1127 family)